jgi:hypothetical protein
MLSEIRKPHNDKHTCVFSYAESGFKKESMGVEWDY